MKTYCKIVGCDRQCHGQDLCGMHYQRWRVNGDPLKLRKKGRPRGKGIHGCAAGAVNKATPEYTAWVDMISRCENPSSKWYRRYGGRGVSVCPEWRSSFLTFLADVGRRPSNLHSIDRIDNDGDYEPSNVRWATHTQQMRNRINNRLLEINGDRKCIAEWAEISGIKQRTILNRLQRGWGYWEAVFTLPNNSKRGTHGLN